VPEQSGTDKFLPPYKPAYALDPDTPANLNTVTLPDVRRDINEKMAPGYMEIRYLLQDDLTKSMSALKRVDSRFKDIFGRGGDPFIEQYLCDDAEFIAVAMGSLSYHLRDVVDALRKEGIKAGVMSVQLYRPFPAAVVAESLRKCTGVIVFEKALSYGYQGPLCSDVKSALFHPAKDAGTCPFVLNYILGLGGREIVTKDLYDAFRHSCTKKQKKIDALRWIGLKI